MSSGPLISIIIPVYNTEKYLEECLNSIIHNDYKNLEIICINDGSTDYSLQILRDFSEKDKRIKVISTENGGVSRARNIGLKACTGDFVSFIDSDDYVVSNFFSTLMGAIEQTDADMAICNFFRSAQEDQNGIYESDVSVITFENAVKSNHCRSYIIGRIYKYRRDSGIFFDEGIKLAEDTIYNIQMMGQSRFLKIVKVQKALYFYRDREDSAVHTIEMKEMLNVVPRYLELVSEYRRKKRFELADVLLEYALKGLFSYRYYERFSDSKAEVKANVRKYLPICTSYLKQNNRIKKSKKAMLLTMAYFPILYRAYMAATDRNLLRWEIEHYKSKFLKK